MHGGKFNFFNKGTNYRGSSSAKIWTRGEMIWTLGLLMQIALVGAFAYYRQLKYGLVVTNMRDYVSWGIYISNFVFFVAISLLDPLITAIFRLANVPWRHHLRGYRK